METPPLIAILLLLSLTLIAGQEEYSSCGLLGPNFVRHITNSHFTQNWPWHAAIYHRFNEANATYVCGGTVISSNYILTAAHCVSMDNKQLDAKYVAVSLGRLNLGVNESSAQDFEVVEIIVHSGYTSIDLRDDIAIIRLSDDATFNNYVQPICMWESSKTDLSEVVGKLGTVVGWGMTETGQTSNILQEASLPIVSTAKCVESDYQFYAKYIKETNFCAGFRNGTSVCQGDSGGSMTIEEGGIYYIRGIVSFGPRSKESKTIEMVCDTKKYAIFTDVAQYLPWINNNAMLNITIECKNEVRCASLNRNKCAVDLTVLDAFDENCKFVFDDRPSAAVTELSIVGKTDVIPRLSHVLTKFKNLEKLELYSLNIKIVQRVRLAAFRKILKLDLSINHITQIDGDAFDGLKSLEELDLQSNKMKELDVDLFKELLNLKILRLNNNQLEKLPATIFHYNTKLTNLFLYNNKLAELDVGLFKELQNLKIPWLSDNQLEKLPVTIFHYNTKMEKIYLRNNNLAELDVDLFKELQNLKELQLYLNQLEKLPATIFHNNTKMEFLDLSKNKLKELHVDLFKELENLKLLQLDYNQLEKLPATIFHNNTKMEFLDLSKNKLNELHVDLFKELENLSELRLDGNQIEILPEGLFRANVKLTKFHLRSNKIKKIGSDFNNKRVLDVLDLRGNVCIDEKCDDENSCDESILDEIKEKMLRNCSN